MIQHRQIKITTQSEAQSGPNTKSRAGSGAWQGLLHGRPALAADFLTVIATQGLGLAIGCMIYATFVGDQLVYYWAIPGIAAGIAAAFFARRLSKPMNR